MILHSVCTTCSLIPYYHPHDIAFMILHSVQRVHLFHITIHMILHSVCTTCSLIPYYHPHDIAFCLYNVFTYSILPSTWYCILFVFTYSILPSTCILLVQRVHHITIHMILHSVCTTCSLIPYYHPHDIAFCLYNVFTYSILPSTWYCILFVQRVHLFHITIHMILHSVCTTCSLIPYYHPHDIAFCLYNVFTYSILPSTWYCILFVHLFHITIHMILHSVCTGVIPYYHPHDIAFCLYAFTYSILPSTWYCILFVQRVHLFHITIHMILHSVCTTCSLIPYYHPHDIAFCVYNVFHLFHITIHMILHSVCTTCSLIPYYHPHDIAFCLYNVFTYSILPSTWYCILFTCPHYHTILFVFTYSILPSTWYCILFVQRVHLFHITIHMILHSVCTTCSLIPYYHPHDIAFCYNVFTYSILPSTWYCILFVQGVFTYSILPSTWYCITYSILPSTWYCILCVQRVHLFHITIHMILHSVCTTYSTLPSTYSILPSTWYCILLQRVQLFVFTYSILPSTWYCILFVQRVHLFHITIHMILHSVCTRCSLIPHYHPHDIAFCLYAFTYSILPSTWYCILFVQRVHLFHITIHMILHSVCTTCSLIPYYHPHDIAFCVYNVFTYSILPSTW